MGSCFRFPYSTGFKTVNRQCASSLQSLTDIALSIQSGMIDIGIAAGVESMTRGYGVSRVNSILQLYLTIPTADESYSGRHLRGDEEQFSTGGAGLPDADGIDERGCR